MFSYNGVDGQYSMLSRTMGMIIVCLLGIISGVYGQERWKELSSGSKAEFFGVFFVSNDTGYVVGDSATALTTTDGGVTWKQILLPEKANDKNNVEFKDVFFIDKQKGFISGYSNQRGIVLWTEDGGDNWKILLDSIGQIVQEIQYQIPHSTRLLLRGAKEKSYTIGGSSEIILLSQDSGKTWEQLPQAFDSTIVWSQAYVNFYSIVFQDSLNGLACAFFSHSSTNLFDICRTSDGGKTWTKPKWNLSGFYGKLYYTSIYKYIRLIGPHIEQSFDGGVTWEELYDFSGYKIYFFNDRIIYVPSYEFEKLTKIDSNGNWSVLPTGMKSYRVNDMSVPSEMVAYAVGYGKSGGQIFKTTNGGGLPLSVERSEPYHQFTVYPNPITSTLKLTYELSSQNQLLIVSDLLGNMVLEATLPAGTTETTLNFTELPTGTYFCRLGKESRAFVVVR